MRNGTHQGCVVDGVKGGQVDVDSIHAGPGGGAHRPEIVLDEES